MLMFQVFVNVGMTIGIMPITGILAARELRRLVGNHDTYGNRPPAIDPRAGARDGRGEAL